MNEIQVSSGQLVFLIKKSRETIRRYRDLGLPYDGRNKYPLSRCLQWLLENVWCPITPGGESMAGVKLRRELAKAKMQELLLAEKEGGLIPKDVPLQWLVSQVIAAKAAFLDMPRRMSEELAAIIDDKEIEHLLRKEIRRILTNLADGKVKIS
jgi:hypothetical protein